jgi:hypothetical protein
MLWLVWESTALALQGGEELTVQDSGFDGCAQIAKL